jgi:radical SAM-linked protein
MTRDDARGGQPADLQAGSGVTCRYAVDFAVEGDVRFCSHRDMIRLFSRAFARADLPVRFSEGFNPHPRFSLPLPRPVGVATTADRLVVELVQPLADAQLLQRLSEVMPPGLSILHVKSLDSAEACRPRLVAYEVAVPGFDSGATREDFTSRITRLLGSPSVLVERRHKKDGKVRAVDILPYIDSLTLGPAGVALTLRVSQEGTAKPSEVCGALGLTDRAVHSWTRRVRIEWH